MMESLADIWAEIEADYTWRSEEVRFFQNQLINIQTEPQKDQFRRAVVLIIYAHFEGFCKFAFTLYVNKINNALIKCQDANYSIAAASLSDLFEALRNSDKKNSIFRNLLPDDAKLHRFARDKDFVESSYDFMEKVVVIPDTVVDTESNLKPVVLRKNLFRLGFPHNSFEAVEGEISKLLNYRNSISHGSLKDGITGQILEDLTTAVYKIMDEVKSTVMNALTQKSYLRAS